MTEIRGFYTLWLREIKRFYRDRTRLLTSFIQPLLWLVIFAAAFSTRFLLPANLNYQQVHFTRHNRANPALHSHVHGHKRHLGQRIRLHERNLGFPHFTLYYFPRQNGRRQHRCSSTRDYSFRYWLSIGHPALTPLLSCTPYPSCCSSRLD